MNADGLVEGKAAGECEDRCKCRCGCGRSEDASTRVGLVRVWWGWKYGEDIGMGGMGVAKV